jgi:hypothetical protein
LQTRRRAPRPRPRHWKTIRNAYTTRNRLTRILRINHGKVKAWPYQKRPRPFFYILSNRARPRHIGFRYIGFRLGNIRFRCRLPA